MRPPARTPPDDGSLNGKFEILNLAVAAGEIKFKRCVSVVSQVRSFIKPPATKVISDI